MTLRPPGIHVVDVSNMASPRGWRSTRCRAPHNSPWTSRRILYGVLQRWRTAIDVRGELGTCTDAQKSSPVNQVAIVRPVKMGRELAVGLKDRSNAVFVWESSFEWLVYASDMLYGI